MVEFGNLSLSLSRTISLWALCVSLPSHNSQAILPFLSLSLSLSLSNFPLSLSATSGLFLSTHIFLFNLSNSLFLLNLNPQKLWVFPVGFIWFFCGFVWVQFDYLWVLFDLFVHLCFMVFSMICFGFVFVFYFYFNLWVCNVNYVFDEMLLWIVYELWSNKQRYIYSFGEFGKK